MWIGRLADWRLNEERRSDDKELAVRIEIA